MSAVLFVRIQSELERQELEDRALERKPRFLEVPGLIQKVYGRNPQSGDWCGIYFFENMAALEKYRDSELVKSIPGAYEATDVRREVFEVMYPLRPDAGPVTD